MEDGTVRYDEIDPAIETRIDGLLAEMTLEEKVGQLVQIQPFAPFDPEAIMEQRRQAEESGEQFHFRPPLHPDLDTLIRSGRIGSIFGTADVRLINHCQQIARESRLGIPLIVGNDVIHGLRTVFPIPLAEACTWNPPLLERAARLAAEEASATGTDWIFAPMIDVARDPRWGRIAEGAGEDPYLTCVLGQARVRGFQSSDLLSGRRIAACPKHYVAYGAAEAGRDYNTVDISERTLRQVYLPPFYGAFAAGAGTVMTSFNEIAGIPATINPLTVQTVLRTEWNWPGVTVSDYEAIRELIPHGVAADLRDAARQAILAGLDMDMMSNAYAEYLADLVTAGEVPLEAIDIAVRRVLRLKLQLGLFEQPLADESLAERVLLRPEFRALALQVAEQSMVLLKNDNGVLPLLPAAQHIALVGPLADSRADMLGTWSFHGRAEDAETVLDAFRARLPAGALRYEPGCSISSDDTAGIPAAVQAARAADVVVLVLGESAEMSGEARSRAHLNLPGRQQELVDAIAATGTPIVAILMTGRPLVIPRLAEQVAALLVAWHPGIRAGSAVANILLGDTNPSGKLTASWPRTEGQIPVYYAHKPTGRPVGGAGTQQFEEPFKSTYMDIPNAPLFPFGFGLSYTTFEYSNLDITPPITGLDGAVTVSATIRNGSTLAGDEIVQLYIHDVVASVSQPVKVLKAFQRITLQPGEAQTVEFPLPISDLGFIGRDMRYTVEPGAFEVWIAPDSVRGLQGSFEVQSGE